MPDRSNEKLRSPRPSSRIFSTWREPKPRVDVAGIEHPGEIPHPASKQTTAGSQPFARTALACHGSRARVLPFGEAVFRLAAALLQNCPSRPSVGKAMRSWDGWGPREVWTYWTSSLLTVALAKSK